VDAKTPRLKGAKVFFLAGDGTIVVAEIAIGAATVRRGRGAVVGTRLRVFYAYFNSGPW
jgi:hypothetical protein